MFSVYVDRFSPSFCQFSSTMASEKHVFNAQQVAGMLMNYVSNKINDSSEYEANLESESDSEEE